MKLPKKRWIVLTLLIAFILFTMGAKRIDIGITCPLCLQSGERVEKELFGIPYYHHQWLRPHIKTNDLPPGVPLPKGYVDPTLYEEIYGHPCTHVFKKMGFCRSTFGLVGCGWYGEGSRLRMRNDAAAEVFHAYTRIGDKAIARKTLDLLEIWQPINSDEPTSSKFYFLIQNLPLIKTSQEWERMLVQAEDDESATGSVITDVSVLKERLSSGDQRMQLAAIDALATLNTPEAWKVLAGALKRSELVNHAGERIRGAHHLSLYPAMLKSAHAKIQDYPIWPLNSMLLYDTRFTNDELRKLFQMRDAYVDRLCLGLIWKEYRFDLLDDVMAVLDDRPSPAAKLAVEQLLIGPRPFTYLSPADFDKMSPEDRALRNSDPWTMFKISTPTNDASSLGGYTSGARKLIREEQDIIKLAEEIKPEKWDPIHETWEKWVAQRAVESTAAAFAQVMYQCDSKRTRDWLAAQFPGEIGSHRFTSVLASMGATGDASFLPALEAFDSGNPRDDRTQFWRPYLDYALHRCRRIQDWKLVQDSMGHYHIEKPAHP